LDVFQVVWAFLVDIWSVTCISVVNLGVLRKLLLSLFIIKFVGDIYIYIVCVCVCVCLSVKLIPN
jgi:hypothetical protein